MKIRSGFVSNSSSSIFVILFPPKFDKKSILDKIEENSEFGEVCDDYNITEKALKDKVLKALKSEDDIYEYDDHKVMRVLEEVIPSKYIVASFDTSSDMGQMIFLDTNKIEEILNES